MIAYLLDRENERLKIGWTLDPESYLVTMAQVSKLSLELIAVEEGFRMHKEQRCRQLAKYAVEGAKGGWFIYTPKVEALVRAIADGRDRVWPYAPVRVAT